MNIVDEMAARKKRLEEIAAERERLKEQISEALARGEPWLADALIAERDALGDQAVCIAREGEGSRG